MATTRLCCIVSALQLDYKYAASTLYAEHVVSVIGGPATAQKYVLQEAMCISE